jgi:hypothetical protein
MASGRGTGPWRSLADVATRAVAFVFLTTSACGAPGDGGGFGDVAAEGGVDGATAAYDAQMPNFGADAGTGGQCVNLQCQRATCTGGSDTTLSGRVTDPSGERPVYNVIVYVPNSTPQPFARGPTCDQCGVLASGDPVTSTLTAPDGTFTLKNVPVGTNIPIVVQIGKWRHQDVVSTVSACTDNRVEGDRTKLPSKHGPVDDIPWMAIATGGCDPFECLLLDIGVDPTEISDATGAGHIQLFQGAGGSTVRAGAPTAQGLWANAAQLASYDMIVNACECQEHAEEKPQSSLDNMYAYANGGGRLFTTHYQYYWMDPTLATPEAMSPWENTNQFIVDTDMPTPILGTIDQTFPKGAAFAKWLLGVGASSTLGVLQINDARNNSIGAPPPSIQWITTTNSSTSTPALVHSTFNTPVGVPDDLQCGKVLYSDFHVVDSTVALDPGATWPTECEHVSITPQQEALEFMLFDLSSCIQNDGNTPVNPP